MRKFYRTHFNKKRFPLYIAILIVLYLIFTFLDSSDDTEDYTLVDALADKSLISKSDNVNSNKSNDLLLIQLNNGTNSSISKVLGPIANNKTLILMAKQNETEEIINELNMPPKLREKLEKLWTKHEKFAFGRLRYLPQDMPPLRFEYFGM